MRYLIFILCLSCSSLVLAQSPTVYQEAETGKYYHAHELKDVAESRNKTYKMVFPNMTASFAIQIREEIIRNDSLIKVFEWKKSAEGKLEKIYEYEGKKLPDYKFKTLENKKLRLSELEGKPVFIDLWFTSCRPCIAKFPELNKIAKKHKDELHFVAITFDPSKEVEELLKNHPLDYLHLVDAEQFLKEIGQQLYPKYVLLDESGKVVFISESFQPLEKEELKKVIKSVLKSN